MLAVCPKCSSKETVSSGVFSTLMWYSKRTDDDGNKHHHDDNRQVKDFTCCDCGHGWTQSKVRKCSVPGCGWRGQEYCTYSGSRKVEEFDDARREG